MHAKILGDSAQKTPLKIPWIKSREIFGPGKISGIFKKQGKIDMRKAVKIAASWPSGEAAVARIPRVLWGNLNLGFEGKW
ncbi:MAG: hypothetical protein CM15mP46_4860 [Alphaproteobacteria bacterium]|nr:MAG: hypothetical protein CM15mP46_4860 [Alphaproteobacteria bacterium]